MKNKFFLIILLIFFNFTLVCSQELIFETSEIKTFEEDKQIPFGIKSAFFTGYATGIIYQYMYMWLILGGVASGLTIAYKYTPIELEKNTRHKLMEYPLARRYLFDTEKVEKIESRKWLYFI